MPTNSPQSKGRLFNILAVCVFVIVVLAVKPAKILYHQSAMRNAWSTTIQTGATNSQDIVQFERHRDALVSLGYFARESFALPQIKPRSPEQRALFDALNDYSTKAVGYFSMQGFETSTEPKVIIWTFPAQMRNWEGLIKSYSQPQTRTNKVP